MKKPLKMCVDKDRFYNAVMETPDLPFGAGGFLVQRPADDAEFVVTRQVGDQGVDARRAERSAVPRAAHIPTAPHREAPSWPSAPEFAALAAGMVQHAVRLAGQFIGGPTTGPTGAAELFLCSPAVA